MATLPAFFTNTVSSESKKSGSIIEKNNFVNVISGPELKYVQDRCVGSYLLERLEIHGHQIAQVDPTTGDFTTFNDIKLLSLKLAKGLRNQGIGHGDVVGICSNNNLDVCLPMLGALYVGASVLPLHSSLCRPDLKHLLSIGKPKIIFSDYTSIEIIRKSLAELKLSVDLIIFGGTKIHKSLELFLDTQCDGEEIIPFNSEHPWDESAFIVPTTGTRDLPKGVNISHGNILHHLQSHWDEDWSGLAMFNVCTIYSIAGIKSMLACLDHGNTVILAPEFTPGAIAKVINDWKGSLVLIISTAHFTKLVDFSDINKYNMDSCKMLIVHGSRLTDVHYKLADSVFGSTKLLLGYGSVETTGMVTTPADKKFSIGTPDPDTEIKIVDTETQRALGPAMVGELYIRGKRIMTGYYDDPLASCESIDKEGWYHTGDIGYFDDSGCFYIDGCIADKFMYKNCEIMPYEIEKILLEHSEIKEICVTGVRNKFETRAKAFIVRENGSTISETRIRKYLEGQLSPFKQLHGGIVFMEKLPTTPSGKINRRILMKLP